MIENLTIGQAQKLSAPAPFALVSVQKEDGSTNLMAASWWTWLSNHPPMLGVCLSNKGMSGALIARSGEFALSLVGEALKEPALSCGHCHGFDRDKAAEFGIPLMPGAAVQAQVVAGSRVIIECRLVSTAPAGDHTFYIGEILSVRGDAAVPQLFAYDGYARLDTV